MSRMQNILDKAERDGAVLRLRPASAIQDTVDARRPRPRRRAGPARPRQSRAGRRHAGPHAHADARSGSRAGRGASRPTPPPPSSTAALCTRIVHADQGSAGEGHADHQPRPRRRQERHRREPRADDGARVSAADVPDRREPADRRSCSSCSASPTARASSTCSPAARRSTRR